MTLIEYKIERNVFDTTFYGIAEFLLDDGSTLRKKFDGLTFLKVKTDLDRYIKSKE